MPRPCRAPGFRSTKRPAELRFHTLLNEKAPEVSWQWGDTAGAAKNGSRARWGDHKCSGRPARPLRRLSARARSTKGFEIEFLALLTEETLKVELVLV